MWPMTVVPDDLTDAADELAPIIELLQRAAGLGLGTVLGLVPPGQEGMRRVAQPGEELVDLFTQTYQHERPALVRLAAARIGTRGTAEDVVQRAFLSVWRQLQRDDRPEIASLPRYTCTAVTREVYREIRALIADRERAGEPVDHPDPATVEAPTGPLASALERALEDLTPRMRQAVVLRFQADRDVRQTAALMGVGEGSVKRYTADGLARLRQALADHPAFPTTL